MGEANWSYTSHSNFKSSPKFSFTSAIPFKDKTHGLPGPGQYGLTATEKDKFRRSASWSIGASKRDDNKSWGQLPGPGAYTPSDPSSITPKCSFGASNRLKEKRIPPSPGPGAYDIKSRLGGAQVSIVSKQDHIRPSRTPGPGQYKPSYSTVSNMGHGGQVTFAGSSRPDLKPSKTPGPGEYPMPSCLGANIFMKQEPRIAIAGRYKLPDPFVTPGPMGAGTQFK